MFLGWKEAARPALTASACSMKEQTLKLFVLGRVTQGQLLVISGVTVCRPAAPADIYRWPLKGLFVFRSGKEVGNHFIPMIPTPRRLRQDGLQF